MRSHTITLIAGLTLALATTPALAQNAQAIGPETLRKSGPGSPYLETVQLGDTLYLAGQRGLARPDDADQTNGVEAETRRAMDRVGEALAEYGLTYDALFKCTVWLTDIYDADAFDAVYSTYFEEGRDPVRSFMVVPELSEGAQIELGCIASIPQRKSPHNVDWNMAVTHFRAGEAKAPKVYTAEDATRCIGRWRLHADAVDDGAFPKPAVEAFSRPLAKEEAIASAILFRVENMNRSIMQGAAQEAEERLGKALEGDREALQAYFDALGRCSHKAETAIDAGAALRGDEE